MAKKVVLNALSVLSLALVIRHAMRMGRIVLPSVACLALPYFPILTHKRQDFRGKYEQKLCFDFPYNFCLQHSSL